MKLKLDQIRNLEKENEVTLYPKRGIALAKGEGIFIYDTEGKRYIDCMTNIGVNILGYGNAYVANPIAEQLQTLPSTHQSFYTEKRAEVLAEITSILPESLSKIIFTNSGAESVEAALKLAISATGKNKFIACVNGYHGRTFGALAATGQEKYREPYLPLKPEFTHIPFNDITAFKKAITNDTAAVLLEPIQGEGGVLIPDKNYLKQVKKLCTEKKILLICDEVQSAIRTGTWLASSQFGVTPDIVCLSKSLSYGLPFGIVATTKPVSDLMPKGAHGSTFAGNPLSCAATASVLSFIKKKKLLANAAVVGDYFIKKLQTVKHPLIKEIRGRGLMIAMELSVPSTPYIKKLQDMGLITIPTAGNAIRFLPPITLTKKDVDAIIKIVEEVFS
jgi:[amino-group carrier protein]-gamma-(L-lysyl/L-ornithyl)-L-glutamate aminotransferase